MDFAPNSTEGTWWVRLHLSVLDQTLRYVVAIQRIGQDDFGVLAVTVFAEILTAPDGEEVDERSRRPMPVLDLSPSDSVTLIVGDQPEERWPDVEELVERSLAAAVDEFGRQIS